MTNHYLWEQKTCAYPNTVTIGFGCRTFVGILKSVLYFSWPLLNNLTARCCRTRKQFWKYSCPILWGVQVSSIEKEACRTFFAFIHPYVYNMLYNEANILYKGGNILYKGGNILYIDIEGTFKFHITNCTSFTHTWALLGCGAPWNSSTP